jgi:hypothetical protein
MTRHLTADILGAEGLAKKVVAVVGVGRLGADYVRLPERLYPGS